MELGQPEQNDEHRSVEEEIINSSEPPPQQEFQQWNQVYLAVIVFTLFMIILMMKFTSCSIGPVPEEPEESGPAVVSVDRLPGLQYQSDPFRPDIPFTPESGPSL